MEKLWRVKEAAAYLQIARSTIWKKVQRYRRTQGAEGWESRTVGKRGVRLPDHVVREAARHYGIEK